MVLLIRQRRSMRINSVTEPPTSRRWWPSRLEATRASAGRKCTAEEVSRKGHAVPSDRHRGEPRSSGDRTHQETRGSLHRNGRTSGYRWRAPCFACRLFTSPSRPRKNRRLAVGGRRRRKDESVVLADRNVRAGSRKPGLVRLGRSI